MRRGESVGEETLCLVATNDGVFVIGVDMPDDRQQIESVFRHLIDKHSIQHAIIWGDTFPPDSCEEFVRVAEAENTNSICGGLIQIPEDGT